MQTYLINPYEMQHNLRNTIKIAGAIIGAIVAFISLLAILWIADSMGIPM